ncbi:hypothetical protein PO909_030944 [Leuciscus waleckii]
MVINIRTFKTFDALLDALSKKVPLPFGVRTITTPRGTHYVRNLDDVQDGGSYLCSDQKKVKPFYLDEVHKRQVPWNTTRAVSTGQNTVVVRTPKRLTVYKNRDPSMKRVIVVHRRTAPNFETLMDYLSQVMQFPVVKLYTEDGRRVEGLPALILCSGIVVAAGNEPFRIGNYNLQAPTKRFFVEQINKSLHENLTEHNRTKNESVETEGSQPVGSDEVETCDCMEGVEEKNNPIMPTEDDIEKSFRVNEDGSMTVEMKVHLTIKQEEMIHWTTTLSRTSINSQQRAVCNSKPESSKNSLDVTNDSGKESNGPHSLDSKEINTFANKSVGFIKEKIENYGSDTSSEKPKPIFRRPPTPGPKQQRKEASVENIKTVSETDVQENSVGAYSYLERTAQGELTEGYCVVSRSSSSSTRTVSKPGRSESGEVKQKKSHSSFRSSGMAEVLQIQNNGTMGITETKSMHPAAAMEQESDDKSIVGNKNTPKSKKSKKSTSSESSRLGKKIKVSPPGSSKDIQMTSDTLSHTGSEKKTSSAESDKREHKVVRDKNKKIKTLAGSPKSRNLDLDIGNQRWSDKELKLKDKTIKGIFHKVNKNDSDSQGPKLKKNSLDIRSPAHPAPLIKRLQKQRSVNGVRSKSSKQKQELSESVSLPVLQSSSSSVNQYVENWLKKMEPESVPYNDETDHPEIRAVFHIGNDSTDGSEIKSDPEKYSVEDEDPALEHNAEERLMPHPPVQIRCERESTEPQRPIGFCKSMPVLTVHFEEEGLVRMHKSSENLVPPDPSGTSQSTEISIRSGMKPVFQQLCSSVQSIKRVLSQTRLTPVEKEKSSSLPDFSSQVASAFGSPSRAFLSFLSLMTVRDGLSVLYKDESQASNPNICPEALQVMQSLEKISNIKDEDELKASLTSLQSSTSSKLKQSWRDFQEQNGFGESPPLSPRLSEQEFAVEVDLEGETEDQDKQNNFSIEQLLDELNMPEDLHREISSLVEGEITYFNQTDLINDADNTSEISGKENKNDGGSLSGSLEKAADMEEEKDHNGQVSDTTKDDITNDTKNPESQELHLIQPHSPDSETIEKDLGNEDSGIAVPNQSPEGNGRDSSKAEVLEMSDNNQMNAENMQERIMYEDPESENKDAKENCSPTSEQKMIDVVEEKVSELSDDQDNISESEDIITPENIEDTDIEEDIIQNIKKPSEQSDASEPDDTDAKCLCSASETECVPFPDRELAELNEENQYSTAENCVREQADHSDFEETIGDGGLEQETKYILSERESLHSEPSETSLPHHDTKSECRDQTLESSSQEDDQVMSPDVDQQGSAVSEDEDPDPHYNNGSPQQGSNDDNSMTPESECEKTQIEEEHDINEVNNESSEVCEETEPDAEPDSCTVTDPEAVDENVTEKKSCTSDSEPYKVQTLEKGRPTDKKDSSTEERNSEEDEEDYYGGLLDTHNNNVNGVQYSIAYTDTKDSLERESCSSTSKSEHQFEKEANLGMEHGYNYLIHPTEISQELLDLINSALLSSTLTVTCDSNGNRRIEPDKCKMREIFMACQKTDDQYGQKHLPSPNTSDLSDYRPETSDNGGYQSQELFTESGEEEVERLRIFRDIIKQSTEKPKRKKHVKENGLIKSSTWMTTKHTPSTSLKSSSLASFQDAKSVIQEPLCHSRSPSDKSSLNVESVQRIALKDNVDSGDGVLIDKGRWLLKENHLIRNSPPVSMGMYGNGDTTSADTAQDNRSEDSPYQYCENQASPLAVISSSELEDMAKPPTPKCTYFHISHCSDSDPLLDDDSVNSGSSGGDARRNKELKVSPMGESSKMWAKKNGSMSSFASVEFKLPDGKVYPQEGSGSGTNRSQNQDSRTVQEEESREGISLRCGQHCPIL